MRAVNNRMILELLEDNNPNDILMRNEYIIKKAKVLDIGGGVKNVKIGDVVSVYFNDIKHYEGICYCTENNVLFINNVPPESRVHLVRTNMGLHDVHEGEVIATNHVELSKGDKVIYQSRAGLELPDGTEIIGGTQVVFAKKQNN